MYLSNVFLCQFMSDWTIAFLQVIPSRPIKSHSGVCWAWAVAWGVFCCSFECGILNLLWSVAVDCREPAILSLQCFRYEVKSSVDVTGAVPVRSSAEYIECCSDNVGGRRISKQEVVRSADSEVDFWVASTWDDYIKDFMPFSAEEPRVEILAEIFLR